MNRPKYLLDLDLVQDALREAAPGGLTMKELMKVTDRHHGAVHTATLRLRNDNKIHSVRELGNELRFYEGAATT
jgi:hypothetical protein